MSAPPPSSSSLGTKHYWTTTYAHDLAQHTHNPAHTGTSWFSDTRAEAKIVAYLHAHAGVLGLHPEGTTVLDVGSGNGGLLFALRAAGWRGGMVGVDYAAEAVELARRVGESEVCGEGEGEVRFEVWDVMGGEGAEGQGWCPEGGFGVVLDKGTLDAVALSVEGRGAEQRGVCERYAGAVRRLVRVGGVLLLTSCNWTEGELRGWFEDGWEVVGRIRYPTFRFGGGEGQSVSSVCFRRVG